MNSFDARTRRKRETLEQSESLHNNFIWVTRRIYIEGEPWRINPALRVVGWNRTQVTRTVGRFDGRENSRFFSRRYPTTVSLSQEIEQEYWIAPNVWAKERSAAGIRKFTVKSSANGSKVTHFRFIGTFCGIKRARLLGKGEREGSDQKGAKKPTD